MFRITFAVLLICSMMSLSYGQDSAKKTVPVPVKTAPVKTYPKNNALKHRTYKYHSKADSAAKVQAQQTTAVKPDTSTIAPIIYDKSLKGQYQYLLSKLFHYQQPLVSSLWKSVLDTLSTDHRKLKDAQNKLNIKTKSIDSLKTAAANREQSLSASNDQIVMLGIPLSKTAYNVIVWGLVGLFGVTAVVVIARSGNFRREAKERRQLYTELEEEFKTFKIKANDKEKKLARELQTERNKLDDLLGRG